VNPRSIENLSMCQYSSTLAESGFEARSADAHGTSIIERCQNTSEAATGAPS
jgi:hypothetical protein